jgi:hypothetical protein
MGFVGKILESVYRCDSAAAIADAYSCGSLAQEALYQGVEVVYKCDGDQFRTAAADLYTHQCYWGEDDTNQEEYHAGNHSTNYGNLMDELEARNDIEENTSAENGNDDFPRLNDNHFLLSDAALSFEDSILNGPNSINDVSSAGSNLLDSVTSEEPKHGTKNGNVVSESNDVPVTTNVFCF